MGGKREEDRQKGSGSRVRIRGSPGLDANTPIDKERKRQQPPKSHDLHDYTLVTSSEQILVYNT